MRVLVLVLAVIFTGVLTTATTILCAPAAPQVAHARHVGDEVRARVHGGHASHVSMLDQDDDYDDDCGDDDVNAPAAAAPELVGSPRPVREIPAPTAECDGLGPAAGHPSLLDDPPRFAAS